LRSLDGANADRVSGRAEVNRVDSNRLRIEIASARPVVPLSAWVTVADGLLSILGGIETAISGGDRPAIEWDIEALSMESPLRAEIVGTHGTRPEVVGRVARYTVEGLAQIEREPTLPRFFSEQLMNSASRIASVVGGDITGVRLASNGVQASPSHHSVANVDDATTGSESITSFEGVLETLTVHGRPQFNIYDVISRTLIRCYFRSDQLEEARRAFGERVVVYGIGKFRYNGEPESIEVDEIRVRRRQSELPQFGDLEGIDITGSMNPTEYIRRLRDAE